MTGAPMTQGAAFGRVDKLGAPLVLSVVAGWLAFVALALLVIGGAVRDEAKRETAQRALSSAYALAAALAARGPDADGQQAVLATFVGQTPGVIAARIVDAERRELAASTAAADVRDAPAPRLLKPAEKPLYDRARARSAARIGNAQAAGPLDPTVHVFANARMAAVTVLLQLELGQARTVEMTFEGQAPAPIAPAMAAPALAGLAIVLLLLTAPPPRWRAPAAVLLLAVTCAALALTQGRLHQAAAVARAEAAIGDTVDHVALVSQGLGGAPTPLDRTITGGEGEPARIQARADAFAALGRDLAVAIGLSLALAACGAFGLGQALAGALRTHRRAYGAIAPALIGLALLAAYPVAYGVGLTGAYALHANQEHMAAQRFVGLADHASMVGGLAAWTGAPSWRALDHSDLVWILGAGLVVALAHWIIGAGLGLALATGFSRLRIVRRLWALALLPWAIPNDLTALAWTRIVDLPFAASASGGLQSMFAGGDPGVIAAMLASLWLSLPFMLAVGLGVLATGDARAPSVGANAWRRFRDGVLAQLAPAIGPAVAVAAIWTGAVFGVIFLVSAAALGGPGEATITQAKRMELAAFRGFYAMAYSAVLAAVLLNWLWQGQPAKRTAPAAP